MKFENGCLLEKGNYINEILENLKEKPMLIVKEGDGGGLIYVPIGTELDDYLVEKSLVKKEEKIKLKDILNTGYRSHYHGYFEPEVNFICNGEIKNGVMLREYYSEKNFGKALFLDFDGNLYRNLYGEYLNKYSKATDDRIEDTDLEVVGKFAEYGWRKYKPCNKDYDVKFIALGEDSIKQVNKFGVVENTLCFNSENNLNHKKLTPRNMRYYVNNSNVDFNWFSRLYSNEDLAEQKIVFKLDDCEYGRILFDLEIEILAVNKFKVNIYRDKILRTEFEVESPANYNMTTLINAKISKLLSKQTELEMQSRTAKLDLGVAYGISSITDSLKGKSIMRHIKHINPRAKDTMLLEVNGVLGFKPCEVDLNGTVVLPTPLNDENVDTTEFDNCINSKYTFDCFYLRACKNPRDYIRYNGEYINCIMTEYHKTVGKGIEARYAVATNGDIYLIYTAKSFENPLIGNELFKSYKEFIPYIDKANTVFGAFAVLKMFTIENGEYVKAEKPSITHLAVTKDTIFKLNEYGEIVGWEIFKNKEGKVTLVSTDEEEYSKAIREQGDKNKVFRDIKNLTINDVISEIKEPIKYKSKSVNDNGVKAKLTVYIENLDRLLIKLEVSNLDEPKIKYKYL